MKKFIAAALLAATSVFAEESAPPPRLYRCDPSEFKCVECKEGHEAGCNYESGCKASCGKFTPEDMVGKWRGFVVKDGGPKKFAMGEIDANFGNKTVTFTSFDGTSHKYDVSTTMGDTFTLHGDDGKDFAVTNSLVGNLRYTTAMGLTTFENATQPDSFSLGVRSNHTMNMVLFQCNRWGQNSTCDFNMDFAKKLVEPAKKAMGRTPFTAPECGKCDKTSNQCYDCDCGGSDADCKPIDQCHESCVPTGPRYRCQWNSTHGPQCNEDRDGTMSKDQCTNECKPANYGKCDYENNACVHCTPGADDKDCLYLMSYCNTAKKEGRCKEETLSGLFRTIEANIPYNKGEFDIQFRDGKMFIQDYTTMKVAMEVGDVKKTGNAERGGVLFEVTNWKSDPKIWPHTQMYGMFELSYGEQQIFNFIELAFSDKPIHALAQGLKGRYFLGLACLDKKICDFDSASPIPHREFTPAPELFFLQ